MTNAITYPAAYNVLSCEEMTYTEGGVGVVEAAMAWFPLYGWYKAVSAIHDYRKANINSNWVENGMNATGATKYATRTVSNINPELTDDDLLAIGEGFAALQVHDVGDIQRSEVSTLVSA